ncbi:MAG: Smr/MutS family protein [Alphaproteobacteria bacterium]|nr:Smr/MutS family protein [Alphaproteobacteria bacterium]MDA8004010.1 Smr/MutS family protein [Alphaproteobacteria bacterium]MDA8006117.1 Smr/MutS family protein [Alphaproteobacteria bacterium]MDA8012874.1 Smr/MutS family protein [Alphaproteobacteria bacterium]
MADGGDEWEQIKKETLRLRKKATATAPAVKEKAVKSAKSVRVVARAESAGRDSGGRVARRLTIEEGLPRELERALRLDRREIPKRDKLDLHGCSAAVARERVDAFLARKHSEGVSLVLVITGGDERRGVIRGEFPFWLEAHCSRVSHYRAGFKQHGKGGAFYVKLRRRRK